MHLLVISESMGDISLVLYFRTEFEIILRPAPLSFKSLIISSISFAFVGRNTNEFIILLLRNCEGLVGELGSLLVRLVAMLVK